MSIIVIVANVVVNVVNVSDLQWSPSNLRIHPLQSVDDPHLLETLYHVPSSLLGPTSSIVPPMAMSFVVSPTFASLVVFPMEMSSKVLM